MRWKGHIARMGEIGGAYRALLGKPEGKRTLARSRRRWEDLQEVGWMGKDWVDLA